MKFYSLIFQNLYFISTIYTTSTSLDNNTNNYPLTQTLNNLHLDFHLDYIAELLVNVIDNDATYDLDDLRKAYLLIMYNKNRYINDDFNTIVGILKYITKHPVVLAKHDFFSVLFYFTKRNAPRRIKTQQFLLDQAKLRTDINYLSFDHSEISSNFAILIIKSTDKYLKKLKISSPLADYTNAIVSACSNLELELILEYIKTFSSSSLFLFKYFRPTALILKNCIFDSELGSVFEYLNGNKYISSLEITYCRLSTVETQNIKEIIENQEMKLTSLILKNVDLKVDDLVEILKSVEKSTTITYFGLNEYYLDSNIAKCIRDVLNNDNI